MEEYEEDIPKVVRTIVTTAMGTFASGAPKAPKPPTDVLTFAPNMQISAGAEAGRALDREALIE